MTLPPANSPANMRSNLLLVPAALSDLQSLETLSSEQLADLGQLTYPYVRNKGERGFQRISWDKGMEIAGQRLQTISGDKMAFLAGAQTSPDEGLYCFSKWAYASQCPNIDCWGQESWRTTAHAFHSSLGSTDSSSIPEDLLIADVILLWGSLPSEWSDEMVTLLVEARARGSWVLLIHPMVSEQVDRPWNRQRLKKNPSVGRLIDAQISLRPGGQGALPVALLAEWLQKRREATSFIERHTTGFEGVKTSTEGLHIGTLIDDAGLTSTSFQTIVHRLLKARNWISVIGNDFCAPPQGTQAVQAILNLHLATGTIGYRGSGLINLSGTPTSATAARFGLDPERGPNGRELSQKVNDHWSKNWGFPVSRTPGFTALRAMQKAHAGELDALIALGPMHVPAQIINTPSSGPAFRVHIASHFDRSMLLPGDETLIFPVLTAGMCAGTSLFSTAFRFIHFHEQSDALVRGLLPCWRVIGQLAAASRPALSGHLRFQSADSVRTELSQLFASHRGVDTKPPPKWLQWPSPYIGGHFEYMPNHKASFRPVHLPRPTRGRQFLAIHDLGQSPTKEALLLLSEGDAQRFALQPDESVTLASDHGSVTARVQFATVRQGCAWTHNADLLDAPTESDTPGWRAAKIVKDPQEPHETS